MPINECCNRNVICCEADTALFDVAGLMRRHHVGDVIVIEEKGDVRVPVGIVTDRDIVTEILAQQVDANVFTAGDLMSAPLVTVQDTEGIVETLRTMRRHKIRRLPVVTASGSLAGIVTTDDIVSLLTTELSMVAEIYREQPAQELATRR